MKFFYQVALSSSRASAILEHADDNVMAAIQAAQRSYTITDPSLPDNPIIFASKGFLELTGYSLENTLGRNCRFLQGIPFTHTQSTLTDTDTLANFFKFEFLNCKKVGQ